MIKIWMSLILFTSQLTAMNCWATEEQTSQQLKLTEYQADIRELAERIKQEHPRPFRMLSEAQFDQLVAEEVAALDQDSTQPDVLWSFSKIIAAIGCGHTRMPYFNQEKKFIAPSQRFPLDVRFIEDALVVIDPLANANNISTGEKITSINGQDPKGLINMIYKHIGTDAHLPYKKRHQFNVYATDYLTYALGFPAEYRVVTANNPQVVRLQPLIDFQYKPILSPKARCQDTLCYQVAESINTSVLTLRSFNFYGADLQTFQAHVDTAFVDLVKSKRDNLIIDVRGNQGGSNSASAYVLRHLHHEPFKFFADVSDQRGPANLFAMQTPIETGFNGKVYVLMDGDTSSSVPHFLSLVKEHQLADLVGAPAGGNKSTNDGAKQFKSTHLGIQYNIARMRFEVEAPSLSMDEALEPDIYLPYTIEQVISGEDLMLDELFAIIQRH